MTCNEINERILSKLGKVANFKPREGEYTVEAIITADEIYEIAGSLVNFEKKLGGKRLNMGGFGELMVASRLGLSILSGQTTRGPDAVTLKDSHKLKKGRYQIKYRNWDTSDIVFRIDVDNDGKFLEKYSWDYLLIATHEGAVIPNRLFCLPVLDAIGMSEILIDRNNINKLAPSASANKSNFYFLFRLNWTWDRKNKIGCVGRKRKKIIEKYENLDSATTFPVSILKHSG